MKNLKNNIKQAYHNSDISHEQLINLNTTLSDINMHTSSNLSNKNQSSKEIILKEKLSLCIENIEGLSVIRNNVNKSLKYIENYSNNFYEDAKIIFKKLKEIHNEKLVEISDNQVKHFQTEEDAFSNKFNRTRNNAYKKRDHSLDIKRSLMDLSLNDNKNKDNRNKINELNKCNQ